MYEDKTVAVVVPAYNEGGFVGDVIDAIPSFVDRIYPVDDCSTDETWDEIRSQARRSNGHPGGSEPEPVPDGDGRELRRSRGDDSDGDHLGHSERSDGSRTALDPEAKRVVPLRHEENRGVGAAIKTGYRRAHDDGIDVVAVMAGDGQMDPDVLDRLLDPVVEGRADYAKGNRLLWEAYREEMSGWRLFGNALLTLLTKISSGYWKLMDPQNGYTAVSREALDRIDLEAVFDDYGFTNAMLVHCNVGDVRVADVPTPARYGDEESDIRYSTFVPQLSALLARGFVWRVEQKFLLRDFHPLAFLYGLGVLGTLGGVYATVRNRLAGRQRVTDVDSGRKQNVEAGPKDKADADGNMNFAKRNTEAGQGNVSKGRATPPSGCGFLTALVGLVTTVLAMSFDVAENEHLQVTVTPEEVEDE